MNASDALYEAASALRAQVMPASCPTPDVVTTEMILAACAAVIQPASKADIESVMPAVHTIMLADGLQHGANADMVAAQIATMIPFYKAMRPLDPYVVALERDARRYRWLRDNLQILAGKEYSRIMGKHIDGVFDDLSAAVDSQMQDAAIDKAREKSDER